MDYLRLLGGWKGYAAAGGVCLVLGTFAGHKVEAWRQDARYNALVASNAKAMQDYSDRAYQAETTQRQEGERRQDEKDKIQNEAKNRIAAAQADALRASGERDRLRKQVAAFSASHRGAGQDPGTGTRGQGEPGQDAIGVLAALLDRHTAELVEVGRYADDLRNAGAACEAQYGTLTPE